MDIVLLVLVTLAAALAACGAWLATRQRSSALDEAQLAAVAERVRSELAAQLAATQAQALQHNTQQFLALAETRLKEETARGEEQLKARGAEIDLRLEQVSMSLRGLREYVETTDRARGESVASLVAVTAESRKALDALTSTTGRLTEVLGSGQSRGQWGERMAEDILRVAGFIEGVQYRKNHQLEGGTGRPEFTFLLPEQRVLHMDVKFPLAAYLRYLEAAALPEQEGALREFLRDARARIREVTSRDYIDPASGTLDYVLLFIPNEQVYGFLHERDPDLLDGALNQRVVLCSPFTLFAVLAVIRQAIDNFHLSQRTDQILEALGGFNKQWGQYKAATERVARSLDSTQRAFEELTGRRTRVLDREVDRVERLRIEAGLHIELPPDTSEEQLEPGSESSGLVAPQEEVSPIGNPQTLAEPR